MVLDGKRHNPKKFGKVMTCDYCGSYLHLANKCWEKQKSKGNYRTYAAVDEEEFYDCEEIDSDEEEAHMSHVSHISHEGFMEGEDEDGSEAFIAHHLGANGIDSTGARKKTKSKTYFVDNITFMASTKVDIQEKFEKAVLLDTGCVRTVCGRKWLAEMISSLDPRMKEKVRKTPSEHWFKFGAGDRMKSLTCVEIDKMNKVCETFGIKLLTTGAYSPNQDGLCEKNHQIVDKIIEKLISDDKQLPFAEALSSAVFAKNMLVNVYGYSPLQLVIGKQPKLPGATSDQLTALEGEHEETK